MEKPFLTPESLASRWDIASKTLSQWRWNGHGPQYYKLGKLVRYLIEDVEVFEKSKEYQHTSTSQNLPSLNPLIRRSEK